MSFLQTLPRRHKGWALVGVLFFITAGIWAASFQAAPSGKLTFAMLNIGQGDSLYIEGPTGIEVLVDGGPDTSVLAQLSSVMPFMNHTIDAVVATHPDADHIGGLVYVLQRYQVGAFIEPGIEKDNQTNDTLEAEVTADNIPHYIARRGMWLNLGGGARLNILFPDTDVTHIAASKDNDGGIVAHLVYGKTSVLLTADVTSAVEEHLMQIGSSSDLESTILKVGHHGSKYSSNPAFVAEVNPQVALISLGAKNTYGFPAPATLSTLASLNIPVLRTDQVGTIIYQSDGTTFTRTR